VNATISPVRTSEIALDRLLAPRGEPLFHARWDRAVFLHYECDPDVLQNCVPFPLDLYHGRAFVSVVAFTIKKMRPRLGGRLAALLFRPIATHHFLNVRTYVYHDGEPGIYFMAEWLSNRLSVLLGPITFGLPYRFARIEYLHASQFEDEVLGTVRPKKCSLNYRAGLAATDLETCEPGSLTEFLLERYTAYTSAGSRKRFFRVWHEPWLQTRLEGEDVGNNNLLEVTGSWAPTASYHSGNYSPGVDVWMGWPHRLEKMHLS
jgi:uncharacterized protein